MDLTWRKVLRAGAATTLGLGAGLAHAHGGHGAAASLFEGLAHPLAVDHLLAAVAVGLWSARALPAQRVWQGPAVFLLALAAGALAALAGVALPALEQGIALSVVLFGAMLVMACGRSTPQAGAGLALVAAAASLHGLAHGTEAAGASFASYAVGFLAATAVLHAAGLATAFALQRHARTLALAAGGAIGATGLVLFGAA